MKFSAKFEYALMTLLYLEGEPNEAPVSGRTLSEKLSIPYRFLEQILSSLKKGGLVRSVRGYQGGYQLNIIPKEVTVYDIYQITEGKFEPWDCAQAESHNRCNQNLNHCVINSFYTDFKVTLKALMEKYTLASLGAQANHLRAAGASSPIEQVAAGLTDIG